MADGEGHLCAKEHGSLLWNSLVVDDVFEQLTSIDVVHEEVDSDVVLEQVLKLDYEWVLVFEQNLLLKLRRLHLLEVNDLVFTY